MCYEKRTSSFAIDSGEQGICPAVGAVLCWSEVLAAEAMKMDRSRGCAALAALAAAIAPPAAWAQTPARPGTACFHVKQMAHLRADGPRTLYARMGRGVLRLDLANDCPDVAVYGGVLVLRPAPSGLVCGPMDINIDLKNHGGTRRCIVSGLTQLTPGEVAAIPRAARP